MRLRLISCEIFYREMCAAVARSKNRVDVEFHPKGLHDIGAEGMLERLQNALDAVDESEFDAVVFGYGLCNNGIQGLTARSIPVVIPRAHDCITLFLGSKERYLDYFNSHSGVYFKTSGWIERGETSGELSQISVQHQFGMDLTYQELVQKYGEDNAAFLYEQLHGNEKNYAQFTFIEMGIEPDDRFEKQAEREAQEKGWEYEKVEGDMSLIQKLVDGDWNPEDFLVVQPGQKVAAKYDDEILIADETDA
jgi:uncharacterized protein DUF1638